MTQPPKWVTISGRDYRVVLDGDIKEYHGECDSENGVITVAADQVPYQERDTVLHEVLHAILRQQGREQRPAEELYVRALATGLLGVLRTNPALVNYLTK